MAAPARNHRGLPFEARVGSAVSLHSNYVRGSFAFARSLEILWVLRPRFNRRGHLVHRYYQKVSCLRYSYWWFDYLGPRRLRSCFWFLFSSSSRTRSTSCSAIRTWSPYHGEGKVTLWFLLKKQTEGVRVIGSFDLAAFMSRSFNCPSETRSRNAITRVTSVLSFSRSHPTSYGSAKKRERPCASLIFLVKSSFGSRQKQEMDQTKKGGDWSNGLCHPNQEREVASVPSQAPTMSWSHWFTLFSLVV